MKRLSMLLCAVLLLSGCEFTGVNSYSLPFTEGSSDFRVTVKMANAVNLVPNSEVKVDNITVGAVRKIEFRDWHAVLDVALNDTVRLPRNAIARIAQKSLLGAEYLELAPPKGDPAARLLADGDTIGLDRTGRYPETEEVLSALSLLLNGGGLDQVKTISRELNAAFDGRTGDFRSVVRRLDTFVGSLDAQRADIVKAMESLDRFAGTLAKEKAVLGKAIEEIPRGLQVLNSEQKNLTRSLRDLATFGRAAVRTVNASREDLLSNLRALQPVLSRLADAGKDLPESLGIAFFPFTTDTLPEVFRGDYGNIYFTYDLTAQTLDRNFLSGGPFEGVLTGLLGPPSNSSPGPESLVPGKLEPGKLPAVPRQSPSSSDGPGDLEGLLNPLVGGGGR